MAQDEKNGRSTGRSLKVLLFASLALNLLIVGFVAGAVLRHDGRPGRGVAPPALSAFGAPYMLALPKEERRKLLSAVRSKHAEGILDRNARRSLYSDVLEALRATPFERSALEAASNAQAGTTVVLQDAVRREWLDAIAKMNDEERSKYAETVEEILKRGPAKRK